MGFFLIETNMVPPNTVAPNTVAPDQCFFSREPQKSGREYFRKSVREYFACAREYQYENVPVNVKSAREFQKCP